MLGRVIPLCYLHETVRGWLGASGAEQQVPRGEVLVRQNAESDDRVFALLEGLDEGLRCVA